VAKEPKLWDPGLDRLVDQFKRLEQQTLTISESSVSKMTEGLLAHSRQFEEVSKNLDRMLRLHDSGIARAASSIATASSEWTRSLDSILGRVDWAKNIHESVGSIGNFARLAEGMGSLPELKFQKMVDDLFSNRGMDALSGHSFATKGVLNLSTVGQAALAVVERHFPEVKEQVEETAANANSPREKEEPTDYVWDAALKRQPPWFQVMVMLLMLVALQPVYDAYKKFVAERWLSSGSEEARSQIVIEVCQNLGSDSVVQLRCTRGTGVSVRESPNKQSAVIGRLSAGQPVEVVETQGAFTHVRYRDASNHEIREGWAASGYLVNSAC
jgi:hypothetical protein